MINLAEHRVTGTSDPSDTPEELSEPKTLVNPLTGGLLVRVQPEEPIESTIYGHNLLLSCPDVPKNVPTTRSVEPVDHCLFKSAVDLHDAPSVKHCSLSRTSAGDASGPVRSAHGDSLRRRAISAGARAWSLVPMDGSCSNCYGFARGPW